jgi:hypothetical protein
MCNYFLTNSLLFVIFLLHIDRLDHKFSVITHAPISLRVMVQDKLV